MDSCKCQTFAVSSAEPGDFPLFVNSVATLGCLSKVIGIGPGKRGGHHTKVEMIGNGMRIPGLAFRAADLLFDFFES
ncbi:MAG: hypothetical protein P8101_21085 [Candidatus Thiodiazotropha sp.]|jgi:hypothetical protein